MISISLLLGLLPKLGMVALILKVVVCQYFKVVSHQYDTSKKIKYLLNSNIDICPLDHFSFTK